jgi:xanthine dehydrogenase accessory factor
MSSHFYEEFIQFFLNSGNVINEFDFAIATLIDIKGSAPQVLGAKMLVTNLSLVPQLGTIGGGKLELKAINFIQEIFEKEDQNFSPQLVTWNLQKDVGMSCGGVVTLFIEFHRPQKKLRPLFIFGAGHVSLAVIKLLGATNLPFSTTVIDFREEWIEKISQQKNLTIKKVKAFEEIEEEFFKRIPPHAFILSLSPGHSFDLPLLTKILSLPVRFPFVGVIGSEVKAIKLKSELSVSEIKINDEKIKKIKCPVGLPISDNTPEQISFSILAELLAHHNDPQFKL